MFEMKYDEELQFMCSDGQVICQTYTSEDNSGSEEGKERAFIYVPKYDLRFIEDVNDK